MNKNFRNLCIVCLIFIFITPEGNSVIKNNIIIKIGNSLVTSIDIQNEIITNLVLDKKEITQESINSNKNLSIQNLVKKTIKKNEINKYKIKNYNNEDLKKYIQRVAKTFNTNTIGLKNIFIKNNINYNVFVENYKTELLWNTLIYSIYKNQINISKIEVTNEIETSVNQKKTEYDLSEIEISNFDYEAGKLKEVLELIKKKGFNSAAIKYSIAPTAEKGGRIGWIVGNTLSKKYLKLVKKIDINGISLPIMNSTSVSIIKLNDIREKENDEEIEMLRKKIVLKKKNEKLDLYSRSHLSNLERSVNINFL